MPSFPYDGAHSPSPSPIPGITKSRAIAASESKAADAAANGDDASHSQHAPESSTVPGSVSVDTELDTRVDSPAVPSLGDHTEDTDLGVEVQVKEQQDPPPLASDKPEVQPEMSADIQAQPETTRPALPTWNVVPTVPEASLVRASSVPPSPPPEAVIPLQPQIDYVFEDIPRLADANSIEDALRTVVMTRLLRDQQTREERVNPVLMENLSLALPPVEYTIKTQEQLIEEVSAQRLSHSSDDPFLAAKSWLYERFDRRRIALSAKTESLRLEYQALHERWRRHCASLNQQAKPVESDNVPVSGRTTRRSAANLGDTVRSDLEMEQIIASLGYDEATDPNQLSTRNLAVIPDMISVTGQTQYTFDDTNHLVENPNEYYAPYTGIHDWTEPEKEMFLDKYAAFPKQFGVIAEFLPNKTASQCVDYYYLHKKKLIDFRRVVSQFAPNKRRRRGTGKQKGNGLLSDIRQHDAEVNRDSDDSPSFSGRPTRGRRVTSEARKPSVRRNAFHLEGTTTGTPTPEPEARPKRRRAAVANRSVLFQDDLDDDTDGEPKKKKRGRKPKSAVIVANEFVTPLPTPPPTTEVDIHSNLAAPIQWSSDDKALFLDLLAQHGENFKRIAVAMPNKTTVQVAEYFKLNLVGLDLGPIAAKAFPISTADQSANTLSSGRTSPIGTLLSSAPSPSASAVAPQKPSSSFVPITTPVINESGSVESRTHTPPQNGEVGGATSVLDPNAIWDSMDPGSGSQSPSAAEVPEPASLGAQTGSSDPSAIGPIPASIVKPTPPMASLARESPAAETRPAASTSMIGSTRSPLQSLKIPKYHSGTVDSPIIAGPSAVQVSQRDVEDADASRREASEKDTAAQASPSEPIFPAPAPAPVMSSLTFDPTWGYYDPDGINRATFTQQTHYPDHARPYSPSHPAPYGAPLHPSTRPPAGAVSSRPPPIPFGMPYPYYIPPPYPSASYPYSSYK
ncbi:hypothetical protein DFH09DRAFT_1305476 [Mycena vulgaris]|nr:hypothetical protein DFH09DRAFT_1305476 [Mycena vulgaris]